MKAIISQISTAQPQSTLNSAPPQGGIDPWVIFAAGAVGSAFTAIAAFLIKISDSALVSKTVDGRINQKQAETNAVVAKELTNINIEKQEAESFIDLSNAVADIARQGVNNSAETTNYLLRLAESALSASAINAQSAATNAQSTQALSRASESNLQATEDLIKATEHNSEALKALKEAIEALPKETASIIEIYATEIRVALANIANRLDVIDAEIQAFDVSVEKKIGLATTQVMEQYTANIKELRKELAAFKDRLPA